ELLARDAPVGRVVDRDLELVPRLVELALLGGALSALHAQRGHAPRLGGRGRRERLERGRQLDLVVRDLRDARARPLEAVVVLLLAVDEREVLPRGLEVARARGDLGRDKLQLRVLGPAVTGGQDGGLRGVRLAGAETGERVGRLERRVVLL